MAHKLLGRAATITLFICFLVAVEQLVAFSQCIEDGNVLVGRVGASVVQIVTAEGGGIGLGSGMIVTSDGYILTNAHVVLSAKAIAVVVQRSLPAYPAVIVRESLAHDLALIKIAATNLPTVELGDSDQLKLLDDVFAMGFPAPTYSFSATYGKISAFRGPSRTVIQFTAPINKANSGGPLVNCEGKVVGVVHARPLDTQVVGTFYAVSIDTAKRTVLAGLPIPGVPEKPMAVPPIPLPFAPGSSTGGQPALPALAVSSSSFSNATELLIFTSVTGAGFPNILGSAFQWGYGIYTMRVSLELHSLPKYLIKNVFDHVDAALAGMEFLIGLPWKHIRPYTGFGIGWLYSRLILGTQITVGPICFSLEANGTLSPSNIPWLQIKGGIGWSF
ncbi:MAG: serine protease [Candidatus Caldarchaeum sp.]